MTERFKAWKQNWWISVKLPISRTALPYLNVMKPENAIRVNHEIDHIAGWNIAYLNVSKHQNTIPEYQHIKSIQDCTAHFWSFRCLKTQFLNISKSTSCSRALHIFQRFAHWNHYSWTSANRPSCRMVLQLTDRFETWKCHSWQSANRHHCTSTQSISERFAAWKQNSWVSAEGPPSRSALLIFERFEVWKRDFWEVANPPHARRQHKNLNDTQLEYAFPEHQQIAHSNESTAHIWHFRSLKMLVLIISKSTTL